MQTHSPNTRWTFARMVAELPPESLYELHKGVLLDMSPSANAFNQDILFNLGIKFRGYLQATGVGKVFLGPLDVVLQEDLVVQPDILVLLGSPNRLIKGVVRQVPDLVIEIVSPGNIRRDTVEKLALYAEFGVKEYWIVYPETESIEVHSLEGQSYSLHTSAKGEGMVKSVLLPGLVVGLGEVF